MYLYIEEHIRWLYTGKVWISGGVKLKLELLTQQRAKNAQKS